MNNREKAIATYEALQKRKEEKKWKEIRSKILADKYQYEAIQRNKDSSARQKKKRG